MPERVIESEPSPGGRRLLDRVSGAIRTAEAVIGGVLLALILVLVITQVVQRFAPVASWAWTGELAKFAMVWVAFILAGYLMGRDQHVTLDIIDHFLPARGRRIVFALASAITAAICIAAAYEGYHLVTNQVGIKSPAAQIPMAVVYAVPMVGMVLTAVRCTVGIAVGRRRP